MSGNPALSGLQAANKKKEEEPTSFWGRAKALLTAPADEVMGRAGAAVKSVVPSLPKPPAFVPMAVSMERARGAGEAPQAATAPFRAKPVAKASPEPPAAPQSKPPVASAPATASPAAPQQAPVQRAPQPSVTRPAAPATATSAPSGGITWQASRDGLSPAYQALASSLPVPGVVTSTARPGRPPDRTHGSARSNAFDFVPSNWADAEKAAAHGVAQGKFVILEDEGTPNAHLHFQDPRPGNVPGYYRMGADKKPVPIALGAAASAGAAPSVPGVPAPAAPAAAFPTPTLLAPERVEHTPLPVPGAPDTAGLRSAYTPGAAPAPVQAADTSFQPAPHPTYTPAPAQDISEELTTLRDASLSGDLAPARAAIESIASKVGRTANDMIASIPAFLQSGSAEVQNFAGRLVNPSRALGGQSPLSLLAMGLTLMDPKASVKDAMEAAASAQAVTQGPQKHASDMASAEQDRRYRAALGHQAVEQPRVAAEQMRQSGEQAIAQMQHEERQEVRRLNEEGRRQAVALNHAGQTSALNAATAITDNLIKASTDTYNRAQQAAAAAAGSTAAKTDVNDFRSAVSHAMKGAGWIKVDKNASTEDLVSGALTARQLLGDVQGRDLFTPMFEAAKKEVRSLLPAGSSEEVVNRQALIVLIRSLNQISGARPPLDDDRPPLD